MDFLKGGSESVCIGLIPHEKLAGAQQSQPKRRQSNPNLIDRGLRYALFTNIYPTHEKQAKAQ